MRRDSSREIRVFLSSTFKDMEAERDYLLSEVFPEVRKECAERSVGFTEIDLRWGVTEEESKNGKTVDICLQEIDRCREYPPFFIGFLGERYGWVPSQDELDKYWADQGYSVKELESGKDHESGKDIGIPGEIYRALEKGISVTELEFDYGISGYDEITPETLFYLRSPELTDSLYQKTGEGDKTCFYDSGNGRLNDLKQKLRKYGRLTIDNYTSVEAFGESVKQSLLAALKHLCPSDELDTPYQKRERAHQIFAQSRRSTYIPLQDELDTVVSYLHHRFRQKEKRPLLILGESGLGKSALMADLAVYIEKCLPNAWVIDRYIGADGDRSLETWRDDLLEFCLKDQPEGTELPATTKNRWEALSAWLYTTANNHQKQIILLLDAINQCYDPLDSIQQLQQVVWPENVALILSSTPDVQVVGSLWKHHQLAALNSEQRSAMVKAYAANFRKGLPAYLIEKLITHTGSELPLYTRLILEELRLHSSHESLEADLSKMLKHDSVQPLFRQVVQQLDEVFSTEQHPNIVSKLVSFLALSRIGLDELELAGLLANLSDPISPVTGQPSLPAAKLSPMLAMLWPYLLRQDGRQRIMHNALIESVLGLEDEVSLRNELIDYFKGENGRAVAERLHQKLALSNELGYVDAGKLELLTYELGNPMHVTLCTAEDAALLHKALGLLGAHKASLNCENIELVALWKEAKTISWSLEAALEVSNDFISKRYPLLGLGWSESLLKVVMECKANNLLVASVLHNLGHFYEMLHDREMAEKFYNYALNIYSHYLPHNSPSISSILHTIAMFYFSQGKFEDSRLYFQRWESIQADQVYSPYQNAQLLANKALRLRVEGDLSGAEALYKEAIFIYESLSIRGNSDLGAAYRNLAKVYLIKQDWYAAEKCLENALKINCDTLYKMHPRIASTMNDLGQLYAEMDNPKIAEFYFKNALDINKESLSDNDEEIVTNLMNLCALYQSQGESMLAFQLLKEIYAKCAQYSFPEKYQELVKGTLSILPDIRGEVPEEADEYLERADRIACEFFHEDDLYRSLIKETLKMLNKQV